MPTTTWTPAWQSPVMAHACTPRRTDAVATVAWIGADGTDFVSHLLPLDALAMAKDLVANPGYEAVTLTTVTGSVLDADAIKAARF